MITDKQVDSIMEEILDKDEIMEKDMNQSNKIDPINIALSSMGTIWKKITTKLGEDSICFMCKRKLEKKEEFDIIEVPENKVDKGLSAFVSVCKKCSKE